MITDKISNIFDFIPETNLVEEFFYEHRGVFQVFSGQTENNGIVAFIDSFSQEGECVSFTTYGVGAGKLFYRNNRYTIGRNCMGLKVKEKYKNSFNLKWFSFNFQNFFYRHRIGDSTGQRSVNKILIQNLEIKIPDRQIQDQQLSLYEKAFEYRQKIEHKLDRCRTFQMTSIQITDFKFEERIRSVFNIAGGNSGLTEEFMYYNPPTTEEEKIPIFSSATQKRSAMGFISKNAKVAGSPIKIFNGDSILIARNGYAGSMTYIKDQEFTTNDHAYVLTIKKQWKDKINLRWFAYQYQELFYNLVTSKSDNATFNKEYAERQKIQIPDISVQNEIAEKLEKIDILISELDKARTKIDELLEYEIT